MNRNYTFLTFYLLIAAVSTALAVIKIGSPNDLNLYRKDASLIQEVVSYRSAIIAYSKENNKLPESLSDVLDDSRYNYSIKNIKSKIDYKMTSSGTYSLCTTFDISPTEPKYKKFSTNYGIPLDANIKPIYEHSKGYQCFKYISGNVENMNVFQNRKLLNNTSGKTIAPGKTLDTNGVIELSDKSSSTNSATIEITIDSFVDDASDINIQNGKIWLHNVGGGAAPGRHAAYPQHETQVNGKPYNFNFCNDPGEVRYDCKSDPVNLSNFGVQLPNQSTLKSIQVLKGRDIVNLETSPASSNDYLTKIYFDDPSSEPDWYNVKLTYQAE